MATAATPAYRAAIERVIYLLDRDLAVIDTRPKPYSFRT